MPEYPDVVVYVERLAALVVGQALQAVRLGSPFVLRTAVPPLSEAEGKTVRGTRRIGKRIVLDLDDDLFLVIHLMIAGRLRWKAPGANHRAKDVLAVFDFTTDLPGAPPPNPRQGLPLDPRGAAGVGTQPSGGSEVVGGVPGNRRTGAGELRAGSLVFTEASPKKRASLHVVRGEAELLTFDRGGLEVLDADVPAFAARLRSRRHTLKRALTDPTLFSGIGNAYSDEILFRAHLSPVKLTTSITDDEIDTLYRAIHETLTEWADRFRAEVGAGFPDKVTAFRPEMAVHGKFRTPCPVCGNPIQRIVHAANESNYCAHCQTGGRLLADRALSQLLKSDWPRTLEELEERRSR